MQSNVKWKFSTKQNQRWICYPICWKNSKFLLHQILNTMVIYKSHALKCFTHSVIILQVMLLRVLMMLLLMLISSIFKIHILRMPLPFLFSLHCLICCIDSCISPFWYDWKVETKLVEVKYIFELKRRIKKLLTFYCIWGSHEWEVWIYNYSNCILSIHLTTIDWNSTKLLYYLTITNF